MIASCAETALTFPADISFVMNDADREGGGPAFTVEGTGSSPFERRVGLQQHPKSAKSICKLFRINL